MYGYAALAVFQSSDEVFAICRRYKYLQARLILEKQEDLRKLEQRLDRYDETDVASYTKNNNIRSPDEQLVRDELLEKIEIAFLSYSNILNTARLLNELERPNPREIRSVQNYLMGAKPIHRLEREYIEHVQDLILLRPPQDPDIIGHMIERWVTTWSWWIPILRRVFTSKEDLAKSCDSDIHFFSQRRISAAANLIIAMILTFLFVAPISLLYYLSSITAGLRRAVASIGVLMSFTLVFTALISAFTRAKRHEVIAASAAYCAVLAVFFGNVS